MPPLKKLLFIEELLCYLLMSWFFMIIAIMMMLIMIKELAKTFMAFPFVIFLLLSHSALVIIYMKVQDISIP